MHSHASSCVLIFSFIRTSSCIYNACVHSHFLKCFEYLCALALPQVLRMSLRIRTSCTSCVHYCAGPVHSQCLDWPRAFARHHLFIICNMLVHSHFLMGSECLLAFKLHGFSQLKFSLYTHIFSKSGYVACKSTLRFVGHLRFMSVRYWLASLHYKVVFVHIPSCVRRMSWSLQMTSCACSSS